MDTRVRGRGVSGERSEHQGGAAAGMKDSQQRTNNGFVDLGRRFQALSESDAEQLDVLEVFPGYRDGLGWNEVLAKRRVVILAEAGSGKTRELFEQSRLLVNAGKASFFAALEDVGTLGLDGALQADKEALSAWKASDAEAWFFLDSIDEAKKARVRLGEALRKIAHDLRGCESRAHIVLSGRYSDWDFKSDLGLVDEQLPIPLEMSRSEVPSDVLVTQIVNHEDEDQPETTTDKATVLVMLPLDEARVKTFAVASGIAGVDAFLSALQANELMRLARRPLDLGWLIEHWRAKGRFGTLAEMLQLSLRKLVTEVRPTSPAYAPLSADRCERALERIGAGLVLQKLDHVIVPDSGSAIAPHGHPGLLLNSLLSDLTAPEVAELLGRPVFIPVTAGMVRLAQDNNGAVRSLLAARWLLGLIQNNCPRAEIHGRLFAEVYGEAVVIPSMQQTAAWLAIWDVDTARELVQRDPEILVQFGDPGSLPDSVAESVLRTFIARLAEGGEDRISDLDRIRRLVRPAFAPIVRELWDCHRTVPNVRTMLLKCITTGRMNPLIDIAFSAATEYSEDKLTTVFGGRALLDLGPADQIHSYLEYVRAHARDLPSTIVWEVAEQHYPGRLTADDIGVFLATLSEEHSELYFERFLNAIGSKTVPRDDLLRILESLQQRLPPDADDGTLGDDDPDRSLVALCSMIYSRLDPDDAPAPLVNGYLTLVRRERMRRPDKTLDELAHASAVRRRATFWAAAELASQDPDRAVRPEHVGQLFWIHYRAPLLEADLDWFFEDAAGRTELADRKLASDAALHIVIVSQTQRLLLERARAAGAKAPELAAAISQWETPREKTPEELRTQERLATVTERNRIEREKRDGDWQKFISELKESPEQLRDVAPLEGTNLDSRIYHLWQLLSQSRQHRNSFAVSDVKPLDRLVGTEASRYFRAAVGRFWRQWVPTLHSQRPSGERNVINRFDCIGIAGVSLEAVANPAWAKSLTAPEARRAVGYATLELNGFPQWIADLAAQWPQVVSEVLTQELVAEINAQPPLTHLGVLQNISHADRSVKALLAQPLYELLIGGTGLGPDDRTRVLTILVEASHLPPGLADQLQARALRGKDVIEVAADLGGLFRVAPDRGVPALRRALARKSKKSQDALVAQVLLRVCGDGWERNSELPSQLPFEHLRALIKLAYAHVRPQDDARPSRGGVYKLGGSRFDIEGARDALVNFLIRTPGRATYDALRALPKVPFCRITLPRSLALAFQRAELDSEFQPWRPEDIRQFESHFAIAPRSSSDLCRYACTIFANLQHALLHEDFAQGKVLAGLVNEMAVQNWVADRLKTVGGRRYSVERESHVVDEKEPDVRLRVSDSRAATPIEIKVVESWTVPQLEGALKMQLVGQYLRDTNHRWGILLLVHQKSRARGWRHNGKALPLAALLERLQAQAQRIAGRTPSSAQPFVVLLDVSTCGTRVRRPRSKPKRKTPSRTKNGDSCKARGRLRKPK